jgi:hypothetical protein
VQNSVFVENQYDFSKARILIRALGKRRPIPVPLGASSLNFEIRRTASAGSEQISVPRVILAQREDTHGVCAVQF